MNEYSIVVDFQKGNIYTDLSVLVQNDYNAYKLNFEFDKEFERALFKLKYPVENKEWVQDIVDNKLILPVLKDTGDYEYEISIYSEDGRLTGYATEKFHVRSELINTDEIVEPDDRVPVLDNLINETTQLKNETADLKEEVEESIDETNNLDIDVSDKVNKEVNITLTKKDNTIKRVTLKDGTSLMFNWDGTRLGIKTDEDEEYTYVDLQGPQGIRGQTGLTPNLTIGTVETGSSSSATITGTAENPILNLVLEKGDTGETGATGNGILNIVKLSSADNVDTYQINMTDGTYYQFTVTNSTVTNQEFNDLKNRYESLINTLPKVTGTGTDITLNNTSEYYMESILNSTELTQDGTPTPDNPVDVNVITGSNNVKLESKNLFNKNNINDFYSYQTNVTINDDKSITITGDSNSGAHYAVLRPFHQFKTGKTYTISFDYEGNLGQMIMFKTLWETQGNRTTTKRLTFSITENDTTLLGLGFYVDTNRTLKVYNIQIEEDSTATEYIEHEEQNYPIDLGNLEYCKIGDYADQFIRTSGKNLAKPLRYGVYNASTGEYIYSTDYTCSSEPITITSNEYIFSIDGIASGGYAYEFSSSNSYLRRVYIDNTGIYTPTSDASYFQYVFKDATVSNVPLNSNVQIEEGNTVTDYEPYGINEWYLKKNIGKVTFDGSDDEVYEKVYGTIKENKCLFTLKNAPHNDSDYNLIKSNRFEARQGLTPYYNEGINITVFHDYIGLILNADKLTEYTTDALRVFFQNNNTDVYLVTETPTYIHTSQADYPILRSQLENLYNNANSYKGQTNITQTNDGLPFNIELSALRDLSTL